MKCIIIDDEATARKTLIELCGKTVSLQVVSCFSNAMEAIKFLNAGNGIDFIFLDIHMPIFPGFDFIQTLKNPPKIILTATDISLAANAFEYDCIVDYLIKPITKERFLKAVKRVSKRANNHKSKDDYENTMKHFFVNTNRRLVKINIQDIYLVEVKGDYISIKTEKQTHIVHSTLKKIEKMLPDEVFLKVHRSYIINVGKIIDIRDNSVLIKKDVIPVSRANRPELMSFINLL